jgi:hypothetical protein
MTLPEKVDYLASLPTDIAWKIAEGNHANNIDLSNFSDMAVQVMMSTCGRKADMETLHRHVLFMTQDGPHPIKFKINITNRTRLRYDRLCAKLRRTCVERAREGPSTKIGLESFQLIR